MSDRVIFHMDINHCYAQIEEMLHPALRDVPMAVGGHEEQRHGIILAKNDLAAQAGVRTGESLREARAKCADLLIVPPAYDDYIYYTELVKEIYRQYTEAVEPFGLDEAWMDVTGLPDDPADLAACIQRRVRTETGLTISAGVSWNKVFAKLGSDMKKPYGLTVITRDNYRHIVWPLAASDLLYVGPATERKLHERGIYTIGELAVCPVGYLKDAMGVAGEMIHAFANGEDSAEVRKSESCPPVQSVSNSMTMAHDAHDLEEIRPVCFVLCEAVASRLREEDSEGCTLTVQIRSAGLEWTMRQCRLDRYTAVSEILLDAMIGLLKKSYDFREPVRAIGLSVSTLRSRSDWHQLSLLADEERGEKARRMDLVMDDIRAQYGFHSVRRACTLVDEALTDFDPKGDHTVHPVGYFQGRKMMRHGSL